MIKSFVFVVPLLSVFVCVYFAHLCISPDCLFVCLQCLMFLYFFVRISLYFLILYIIFSLCTVEDDHGSFSLRICIISIILFVFVFRRSLYFLSLYSWRWSQVLFTRSPSVNCFPGATMLYLFSASSVVVGEMIKQKKTIECIKEYKKMYNTK